MNDLETHEELMRGISAQQSKILESSGQAIYIYLDDNHFYEFDITRDDRSEVAASATLISKQEEPVAGMDKTYRSTITAGQANKPKVPVMIVIKSGKIYLL